MKLEQFLAHIRQGEIPPEAPDCLTANGWTRKIYGDNEKYMAYIMARREATDRGMWAIVYREWVEKLADWIGRRSVLEIMSGPGWLAKALSDCGVDITATDNGEWDKRHSKQELLFPVKKCNAVAAAKLYRRDILLVSWPPYGGVAIHNACLEWDGPIVYIGEGEGGCNAPDEFWDTFVEYDVSIPLMSWHGLHDHVFIGEYDEG